MLGMMLFPALEQYYFFYFGGPKSEEPRLCVHSLISNKEGRLSSEYLFFFFKHSPSFLYGEQRR